MANQLDSFSPNEIRDAANKVIQVIQSKVIRNPDSLILLGYMALIAHSGDPNLTQIVPNIIAAGLYNLIALVIRGKAADQEISDNIEGLQLTLQRSQAKLEREFRHLRFGLDTISQQFPDLYNQLTEYLDARLPPQENSTYPHLDLLIEPTHNQFFVGRNDIIKNILGRTSQIRFTTILGIAGSGKTDLMRELASGLKDRGMRVFWYDFKSDLFSLDSILVRLAQFVDTITGELGNLTQKIRTAGLSYTDRIRLLTNSLNENNYYLFFDAYEEANSEIGSFFSSLKQYLTNTSIFLTSQIVPNFYTILDERNGTIETIKLEGLSKNEVEAFFSKHGIKVASQLAEAFGENVLPMSLILCLGLLNNDFQEAELLKVVEQVEDDSIETLFDKLYDRLPTEERLLLTTASYLLLPFLENDLLDAHKAITGVSKKRETVRNLKKRLLLQEIPPEYLTTHKIISEMMLKYDTDSKDNARRLADYLSLSASSSPQDAIEAILLYIKAKKFNRAADLFIELTDEFITYYPDLAKTFFEGLLKVDLGTNQRIWLLHSHGGLHQHFRRYEEAEKAFSEMLHLAEEVKDENAVATALLSLGTLYHDRDFEKAEKYYLRCLAIFRSLKDIKGQSNIFNNLASLCIVHEKLDDIDLLLNNALKLLEDERFSDRDKLNIWGNYGHLSMIREKWDEADKYANLVRDIALKEDNPFMAITAEYNLGIHQYRQKNYEKALELYNSALEDAKKYDSWSMREMIHRAIGQVYFTIGNYELAIENYNVLAEISEEIEDYGQLAAVDFDIGSLFALSGEWDRATTYYEQGLAYFDHLHDEDEVDKFLGNTENVAKTGEANARRIIQALKYLKNKLKEIPISYALAMVYGTLGHIYVSTLHKDRVGFACLKEQIRICDVLERTRDMRGHQLNLASLYQDNDYFVESIHLTTEIVNSQDESIEDLRAMAFYDRATALVSLKQYDNAEADYQSALKLASSIDNDEFVQDVKHNLGELYRRRDEPLKAIPLFLSVLEYSRAHELFEGEIFTLNNLGLAYQKADQLDEAETAFLQSIQFAQQHYMKEDEARAHISLGNLHTERNDFNKAQESYEHALQIAQEIEDRNLVEGSVISIGYAQWQNGTFQEFESEFSREMEKTAELKHNDNLFQFLRLTGQINISEGEFDAAAEAYSKAIAMSLSLWAVQFMQLAELEEVDYKQSDLIDTFEMIREICDWVDETIRNHGILKAREFYQYLINYLKEDLKGNIDLVLNYITPLHEFLEQLPNQRAIVFVSSRWNTKADEASDS